MDSKRILGLVLIIVGLVVLVVSLFADPLNLGEGTAFGGRQIVGSIVGAVVALIGFFFQRKPKTA